MSRHTHIYVESDARPYPLTERILTQFPSATIVPVTSYKHIFNRPRQDYRAQKRAPKLILAVKRPPFLYPVSENCQTFGIADSFYTTPVLGCPYDCDYCYLHGMLSSANLVVFVNTDDFFKTTRRAVDKTATSDRPLQLSLSYDTDLLALERRFSLCREWLAFASDLPRLIVEIRTKSASYASSLGKVSPIDNARLAWSLSPDAVARQYEHRAPSLSKRIEAMARAARDGWSIRVCIDPVIPIHGWQAAYGDMVSRVFDAVPAERIDYVAIGGFRLGEPHLRRMIKARPQCDLFYRAIALSPDDIADFAEAHLAPRIHKENISIWNR